MTLTEKFAKLNSEQQEKLAAVKDGAGLDAFLTETGLELADNEKTQVLEYLASGKLPLADEELINIAGGGCGDEQDSVLVGAWKKIAESEGRGTHVGISKEGFYHWYWIDARCPSCKVEGSVFSANKGERSYSPSNAIMYQSFYDVKCYACHTTKAKADMSSGYTNLEWR